MYPYITILNKEITSYALMCLIGALVIGFLCVKRSKKFNFDDNDMITILLIAALGAFLGGHILYGIVNYSLFIKLLINLDKIESFLMLINILKRIFGGSVFYGGLFGAILTAYIYMKKTRKNVKLATFIITPFIPLFHFFGRLGCFLFGCCYGIESKWGLLYHNKLFDLEPVRRIPVQLIEAFLNLLLFSILLLLENKKIVKDHILAIYLFLYALIRFGLEFWRGDSYRGLYFGLSTSQWLSLVIIITIILYSIYLKLKKRI